VPFSIAEFVLYALVLLAVTLLIVRIVQAFLQKRGYLRLLKSIAALLLAAGVILNLFYITWGFNYFRRPLSERMGLNVTERSVDELEAFVLKTARKAGTLRETLNEDEDGVFLPEESRQQIFNELPEAYAALSERFPVFYADPTRAKSVLCSSGLSWQGISGVFVGLTAEPNVNVGQPPLLVYQAAAHEMAHQTGIAAENEADFTAYLACMCSDDPNVRYSALVYALIVSGNALYKADAERYLAAADTYGDAIWRDLQDYDAYWDAFDGAIQQSADRRNDAYLKHNAQQSGVESYGEAVDLLLAFEEAYGASMRK
jgi:energy-coupling factor transporter transmembrane protein EcfT